MSKLTRQGVRDLSSLPAGPSKGRRIELPDTTDEKQRLCAHPMSARQSSVYLGFETIKCRACAKVLYDEFSQSWT